MFESLPVPSLPEMATWLASSAAGAGALNFLFNRLSGAGVIEENAANIARIARTKAALQKLFETNRNVGSIVFADTDRAHITVRQEDGAIEYGSFALNIPAQAAQFHEAKKHLMRPAAMVEMAAAAADPGDVTKECSRAAKRAQRNWTRPWALGLLKLGADFQKKAQEVNESLIQTAETLVADSAPDANLSGTCHIAARRTEPAGTSHIVVMPVGDSEAAFLQDFYDGKPPGRQDLTGAGIIRAMASHHGAPAAPV